MLRRSAMVRIKITYYTMFTPERRYEIQQEIRARQAAHAARIAVGLPPDSPEPEEEGQSREEQGEEVEQPESEQELPGFNME